MNPKPDFFRTIFSLQILFTALAMQVSAQTNQPSSYPIVPVYVTSYTGNTRTECPEFCPATGAIAILGATNVAPVFDAPPRTRAVYGFGGTVRWTIQPLLNENIYLLQVAHADGPTCSTNVLVTVYSDEATFSPSCTNSPVFQRQYGGSNWVTMGYITNNPGITQPTIIFNYVSGNLNNNNRLYMDAFRFWPVRSAANAVENKKVKRP